MYLNNSKFNTFISILLGLSVALTLMRPGDLNISYPREVFLFDFIFFTLLSYFVWTRQDKSFSTLYHVSTHQKSNFKEVFAGLELLDHGNLNNQKELLANFIKEKRTIRFFLGTALIIASYHALKIMLIGGLLDTSIEQGCVTLFVLMFSFTRFWGGIKLILFFELIFFALVKDFSGQLFQLKTILFLSLFFINFKLINTWYWQRLSSDYINIHLKTVLKPLYPQIVLFLSLFLLCDYFIKPDQSLIHFSKKKIQKNISDSLTKTVKKNDFQKENISPLNQNYENFKDVFNVSYPNYDQIIKELELDKFNKLDRSIIDKNEELKLTNKKIKEAFKDSKNNDELYSLLNKQNQLENEIFDLIEQKKHDLANKNDLLAKSIEDNQNQNLSQEKALEEQRFDNLYANQDKKSQEENSLFKDFSKNLFRNTGEEIKDISKSIDLINNAPMDSKSIPIDNLDKKLDLLPKDIFSPEDFNQLESQLDETKKLIKEQNIKFPVIKNIPINEDILFTKESLEKVKEIDLNSNLEQINQKFEINNLQDQIQYEEYLKHHNDILSNKHQFSNEELKEIVQNQQIITNDYIQKLQNNSSKDIQNIQQTIFELQDKEVKLEELNLEIEKRIKQDKMIEQINSKIDRTNLGDKTSQNINEVIDLTKQLDPALLTNEQENIKQENIKSLRPVQESMDATKIDQVDEISQAKKNIAREIAKKDNSNLINHLEKQAPHLDQEKLTNINEQIKDINFAINQELNQPHENISKQNLQDLISKKEKLQNDFNSEFKNLKKDFVSNRIKNELSPLEKREKEQYLKNQQKISKIKQSLKVPKTTSHNAKSYEQKVLKDINDNIKKINTKSGEQRVRQIEKTQEKIEDALEDPKFNLTDQNYKQIKELRDKLQLEKVKESLPQKKNERSSNLLKRLEPFIVCLLLFVLFFFFKKLFSKKKHTITEDDQVDNLKLIKSELNKLPNKFNSFEDEVRVHYKFFHSTMNNLYYEDEAPPAMALAHELDNEFKKNAKELGSIFNKLEFSRQTKFSPQERNLFRSHYKKFEKTIRQELKNI